MRRLVAGHAEAGDAAIQARKLIAAGLDPLDELDVAIEAKSGKLGYGLRKSVQMASSESI